jgi:hypothetical protein
MPRAKESPPVSASLREKKHPLKLTKNLMPFPNEK